MTAAAPASQPRTQFWRAIERISPVHAGVLLVILTLGVRAIGLGMRPLWLDEAYSAWFSARGWHYLWAVVPTYETHPPFYYSILKLWRGLFGGEAVALRSLSVLLGAATVPVVIAACYELERQQPTGRALLRAAIAGLLAACSPMLVMLGQEARPYPLLILAYAIATWGLLRLIREFSDGGAGTWKSWLLLAVGTEIGLWAHGLGILYAFCLALALIPAWASKLSRARLTRGLAVGAAMALAYAPCLAMVLARSADWGTGWLAWEPIMLLQLLTLYSVPVELLTVGSALAALIMLLLLKRAVQSAFAVKSWNADRALMLLWLGPPLLAAAISALFMPIFLPRTLAAALVPAYLAMGSAVARTDSPRERLAFSLALCLTLIPTAVQIALRPATERWDDVRAYLANHVSRGDQVWLYPNDSALPLEASGPMPGLRGIPADYPAIGVKGPIRAGSPAVISVTKAQANVLVSDATLKNVRTVWLVTRQSGVFDPAGDMPAALSSARKAGAKREWGYITVQPYAAR